MKILILSTSTNNTDTVINSLARLGTDTIEVLRYDTKYLLRCHMAVQANPQAQVDLQAGRLHFDPALVRMDEEILSAARDVKPDVILYISAWEGDFVPPIEVLGQLNAVAPLVHMCFDGGDPPWWSQMKTFEEKGVFSLTVNIDGNPVWPGGPNWLASGGTAESSVKHGITLLTPLDVSMFAGPALKYSERPYRVAYAGNAGGWFRQAAVDALKQRVSGFALKLRDDTPGSYKFYADFLKYCQVSVSVPFTGSNATKHVKGRVLETAYAGGCLLEMKNDATRYWFVPRLEFMEYESIDECCELANWLGDHPKIAGEMAAALQARVVKHHAPEVFWKAVFERLDTRAPMSLPYHQTSPVLELVANAAETPSDGNAQGEAA